MRSTISCPTALLAAALFLTRCATFESVGDSDADTAPAEDVAPDPGREVADLGVDTPEDAAEDGSGDTVDAVDAPPEQDTTDTATDGSGEDTDVDDASTPCPTGTECEGAEVCVEGVCVSRICVPDAATCIDARTAGACDETGTVLTEEDCTRGAGCTPLSCGCIEGQCLKLEPCEPGEVRCLGSVVQRCVATGEGFADERVCDSSVGLVCTNGACGCPGDRLNCDGTCADPLTDRLNCGGCGQPCGASEVCVGGECTCGPAFDDCSGVCTDTDSDPANCGACGNVCSPGSTCVAGDCVCPSGYSECGDECFDLTRDQNNCGACGRACALDQACSGSACRCISAGFTICSGTCVNTSTDNNNCGFCGSVCPSGQRCSSGLCECTGGRRDCGGTCIDVASDRNNCGACGARCSNSQLCVGGTCQEAACSCPSGFRVCNSDLCGDRVGGCCEGILLGFPPCGLEPCLTE